jgi:EAL domain-containing protein (putative c-di-GMP-specific phosphodiesterase class I)
LYGGASIGIAVYPQDGTDSLSLHRNADRAMYRAKAQGGNVCQSSSRDDGPGGRDRLELESHLHKAIEQGNFSLYFQPQYTCTRQIAGFEALLRFRHPKLGVVPPSRFIPIAEESGLILPIGEWVLQTTCLQIAEWLNMGMSPLRVAVNVSPLQFLQPDFTESVVKAIRQADIRPELLELELTEGILIQNMNESARQMRLLAEFGVKFALDDFGTGYSSLSYLHQLPIHLLKIDQSFISNMREPGSTGPIVEAIISLAHGLGLKTVAEGVEHEEQLHSLQKAGCDLVQGFHLSHPVSAVDATCLLGEEQKRDSHERVLRARLFTHHDRQRQH